jgi:2-methylisocitrate lyase-like PEP mutase family enzyme
MWEMAKDRASIRLRTAMAKERPLLVPGAYDALSAKILTTVGFDALYLSSLGIALAYAGLPDIGLVTGPEQALVARHIAGTVGAAVIADADDGHGNAITVMRTVRDFIAAGVAGIELDDQVGPGR